MFGLCSRPAYMFTTSLQLHRAAYHLNDRYSCVVRDKAGIEFQLRFGQRAFQTPTGPKNAVLNAINFCLP